MRFFAFLLLACSLPAAVVSADDILAPRRGVILLKNRQVLQGDVTRVGDQYRIAVSSGAEVRIAVRDVERVCATLEIAYQQKAAEIQGQSVDRHLDLADWCIRQKLFSQAVTEIRHVSRIEPTHRRLAVLEKQIEAAIAPPKPSEERTKTNVTSATVGGEQLERVMRELPQGAVEHFTTVIQPILMDRCGAAKCHGGGGGDTTFQLVQPTPGRVPSKRFSQRNLFATLELVNKEMPRESRLLEMALTPHGEVKAAAFTRVEDRRYRELVEWIESLDRPTGLGQPATVNAVRLSHLQPQMSEEETKHVVETPKGPATSVAPANAATPVAAPRDPFDPEVFNERFGSKR